MQEIIVWTTINLHFIWWEAKGLKYARPYIPDPNTTIIIINIVSSTSIVVITVSKGLQATLLWLRIVHSPPDATDNRNKRNNKHNTTTNNKHKHNNNMEENRTMCTREVQEVQA
jgi:hypothetical protein